MTSIAATSKLIPATGTPRGSGLRCTITVQVNDKGLVSVNGQAVGFGEEAGGRVGLGLRALCAGPVQSTPSPGPTQLVVGQASPHGGHRR